ncbi:MAG: UDP-N-acetylmuramate--alanine ligase [Gammaproteobacteria bacterium RIFCSPLOWO2_02_FULL_42_14]|nr:MAG: UDP-N-acetylmuramate--alanine ligase [Gammaproteobacteria bacterium RIFCSPHIGHO2_02_FULL_42_43]OGT27319.1 MAG: UDP-N-acetylmuramate--alanine ligase [Gammaproteobacteria bacterium RIFCSPHIGHO2_01_FULL_42_8]OGT52772.1 MAG: UDP-N-acetylmuramate--alanine ligase [Gammaproteobacteria bacterium RIFCSPHIGHO2_12_FULL_41_25]OGT63307.1 MAG: UDP-N-acetylmuramate--alanine ligase [Gammaproteobacteria bacterium RIFCSPLOWO2_02_FULL_42_14]OGT86895.1 MAG: UDP-N-acetylmuramate--alanine ligase [Gammaproteo
MAIENCTEKLFSYGTLRYEEVQLSTFGRKLKGSADTLHGYQLSQLTIHNSDVIATSGNAVHPILIETNNNNDKVDGVVFDVTAKELAQADQYEVDDYQRVQVMLESGVHAWVYVQAEPRP